MNLFIYNNNEYSFHRINLKNCDTKWNCVTSSEIRTWSANSSVIKKETKQSERANIFFTEKPPRCDLSMVFQPWHKNKSESCVNKEHLACEDPCAAMANRLLWSMDAVCSFCLYARVLSWARRTEQRNKLWREQRFTFLSLVL